MFVLAEVNQECTATPHKGTVVSLVRSGQLVHRRGHAGSQQGLPLAEVALMAAVEELLVPGSKRQQRYDTPRGALPPRNTPRLYFWLDFLFRSEAP